MSVTNVRKDMPVTRRQIIDVAFDLADRDGPESVSLRAVASRLNMSAMGLYTYVASKDDLMEGIYGKYWRLTDEEFLRTSQCMPGWRGALGRFIKANVETSFAHQRISLAINALPAWGKVRLAFAEHWAPLFMRAGIEAETAAMSWVMMDGLLPTARVGSRGDVGDAPYTVTDPAVIAYLDQMKEIFPPRSVDHHIRLIVDDLRRRAAASAGADQPGESRPHAAEAAVDMP